MKDIPVLMAEDIDSQLASIASKLSTYMNDHGAQTIRVSNVGDLLINMVGVIGLKLEAGLNVFSLFVVTTDTSSEPTERLWLRFRYHLLRSNIDFEKSTLGTGDPDHVFFRNIDNPPFSVRSLQEIVSAYGWSLDDEQTDNEKLSEANALRRKESVEIVRALKLGRSVAVSEPSNDTQVREPN